MPRLSPASPPEIITAMDQTPPQPAAALPTPAQVLAFLAEHHQIDGLDPDKPHQFWPNRMVGEAPYTDRLVLELRKLNRAELYQASNASIPYFSETFRCNDRSLRDPTSGTLFEAASAHLKPWHRLAIAMRMARITAETAAVVLNPNKPNADPIREYLKRKADDTSDTPDWVATLSPFLGVKLAWILLGPTVDVGFENPPLPWWLEPWWELSELADDVFTLAIRRGMLPMLADQRGYDSAAFWACWQAEPHRLVLPDAWASRRLDLLPWLFEASVGFRCGNPVFNVSHTADTWDTLQRLVNWYMMDGLRMLGKQAGKPPAGTPPTSTAPPTAEDMLRFKLRMSAPPAANVELVVNKDIHLLLSPVHTEAPTALACDRGKPRAGRPPGSKGGESSEPAPASP